ncbi:extracellular solute-binding protein [Paenibacillus spongiae]|uniref:Extracellular solute-binding protein n=1 Tax=Paenibacillus spongiae TaxID=2909671 RepID=A0ABY5S7W1_9BACL|nr:extracellular solute-binding protein [Paenibacillus spongiae]UVI28788.1 extracellular solute-binding protein [Paenibacillus spongiae]
MKKKKWTVCALLLMLSMSVLTAGCGDNSNGGTPSSNSGDSNSKNTSEAAKPLTFSYFEYDDTFNPSPWGETVTTKWIQENKNVTVKWVTGNGAAQQKFNAMFASGDLPDVITMSPGPELERLIESGKVVALDEYIDKYPNLKKWAGETTLNMNRSGDGHIYTFPVWYIGENWANGNGGYGINRKVYNDLGSPKLETVADFEAYLRLVKEKYPDYVPLEVGNPAAIYMLYSAFKENNPPFFVRNMMFQDGDQLKPITEDPAFKDFILFASRLFRDKLMTQDVFTQKNDQFVEKLNRGKVGIALESNLSTWANKPNAKLRGEDPNGGYEFIWPIRKEGLDKNKITINSYNSTGPDKTVITTNAEDPESIFAYLDWLTGESNLMFIYGPPGLFWDKLDDNGSPILNEKYTNIDKAELANMKISEGWMAGNVKLVDSVKSALNEKLPKDKQDWVTNQQVNIAWKTSADVTAFANFDPLPDSEEGIVLQTVKDIFNQAFSQMIYAASDEDVLSVLNKANDDMMKAGYQKVLDFRMKKWQENIKIMNGG